MTKKIKQLLIFNLTFFLTSCAVGPNYHRPPVMIPFAFKEAKGKHIISPHPSKDWKIARPSDRCDRGHWWEIFNDLTLNQLEVHLDAANQNLVVAYQNYRQARAFVDAARAAYFPTLTALLSFTRQKGSGSISFATAGGAGIATGAATGEAPSTITNTYLKLLNATWEPDIWGKVRRDVEASSAGAQASAALFAATRLSQQASLAQFYFELRGIDVDQKLLDNTVIAYKKALRLTKNRYAAGVAGREDVVQAQAQLESAEGAAINNGILRAHYEHAIAVLIGSPPAAFSFSSHTIKKIITPPAVPLELPSLLLERRPDIAQAERLMAQANAQVGVAIAAFFPSLTLTGSGSSATQQLFSLDPINWAIGAQLAETLIDGGLRIATIRAAKANYLALVAAYRQTVLTAFQEVEDNLASLRILNKESDVTQRAARTAQEALSIIINQYKAGTVDYTSVLVAQNNAYTAEKTAADVSYLSMTAAVSLIKALGGGWDASVIACAAG